MANKVLYLSGKAYWAKLTQDKLDTKYRPNWNLKLELDEASLNRLKEERLGLKLQENDVGERICISPKRYADADFKDSEKRSTKLPPRVLLKDASGAMKLFTGSIGNGSKVTVKLDTFDTKYDTRGHRLVAVVVDELVVYNPEDNAGVDPADEIVNAEDIPF